MSETTNTNTEKKSLDHEIDALNGKLEGFATKYQPVADAENLSDVAKKALANRRRWSQDALGMKTFYADKGSEKIANAHDVTFRAEKAVAMIALTGARWARLLVGKNYDLTKLLKDIITTIRTVATYIDDPDEIVAPYAGYFEMKCRAAVGMFATALDEVYGGKSSWGAFSSCRDTARTAQRELTAIVTSFGEEVPGTVLTWLHEVEAAKAPVEETVATQ